MSESSLKVIGPQERTFRSALRAAVERGCVLLVTWAIVLGGLIGLVKLLLRTEVAIVQGANSGANAAAYLERAIAAGYLPKPDPQGNLPKREEPKPSEQSAKAEEPKKP